MLSFLHHSDGSILHKWARNGGGGWSGVFGKQDGGEGGAVGDTQYLYVEDLSKENL